MNLMMMILNCKDHDDYRVNLESISMSIWSAGVGGMQAERQLKDDTMIFSIITLVVTFNINNNIKTSNKIHPHLYKLGAKEAKFGTSPSNSSVLPGPYLPLVRVICIVVVVDPP